ncbi:sodium:sulfate symporter [Enterococcus florum]|uniref:Sodium:sulfate symporter n=1 Tax=Enterococcus florum TaxID=2480627 RepID=A0A4P5P4I4_9ENTE|nr:SLC13 family permease [Enterococcus florum]GCF92717.1 sodium:sulfate symporter [Enterococcus florum]
METEEKEVLLVRSEKKKISISSIIDIFAVFVMFIFWILPPISTITPIGMRVLGAFLGMVILWAKGNILWPSIMGLVMIALSGYAGEGSAGFGAVFKDAFGNETVILVIMATILFGGMTESGVTKHIANWILTRKMITGRPYVFIAFVFLAGWILCLLVGGAVPALIMMWPIAIRLIESLNIKKEDRIWSFFFIGMFATITLGMPLLPFRGAVLAVVGAYEGMTGLSVDYLPFMLLNFIITSLFIFLYIIVLKFIIKPDVSKMKDVDAEKMKKENELEPMNIAQKIYLFMVPTYVIMLLLPSVLPETIPGVKLLSTLGTLGVTSLWIVAFLIVKYQSRELLNFKEAAYKHFAWGIYFMIAAAVYAGNTLSNDVTGIKGFLIQILDPILGGRSEFVFVAILFLAALILTSFANNAAMGIVLLPVAIAFCEQKGIAPTPVIMCLTMLVFMAMLTPAASPHASMMFGHKDIYDSKDIMKLGFPIVFSVWLLYLFVGYPLAKILF